MFAVRGSKTDPHASAGCLSNNAMPLNDLPHVRVVIFTLANGEGWHQTHPPRSPASVFWLADILKVNIALIGRQHCDRYSPWDRNWKTLFDNNSRGVNIFSNGILLRPKGCRNTKPSWKGSFSRWLWYNLWCNLHLYRLFMHSPTLLRPKRLNIFPSMF